MNGRIRALSNPVLPILSHSRYTATPDKSPQMSQSEPHTWVLTSPPIFSLRPTNSAKLPARKASKAFTKGTRTSETNEAEETKTSPKVRDRLVQF